ncbi:phosphoribosylglycinamide formyltransferase [Legionella clemsonensis]|uniref:Phosphoribosylglycinamide formyltransferase n=1 Tax=Legionella clemsonensis TaxID=1867846 RepID=A0A222P4R5_9GAMM|nr:phosphoribosylglycinamide formyltransferase [Legionella clemsonensis]ASQ46850.1 Phosphoribosylglycinamide formyltransferase [Legionella clemsonensis]
MLRLGILGSTRGTNLTSLIDAIHNEELDASIEVVISNKMDAPILERATNFGLKALFANPADLTRQSYDFYLSNLLKQHHVELVVLMGYMRILSPHFVLNWKNKIINVHPSLLPAFSGLMDLKVHQAVLDTAATVTGCSVHFVTEEVDAGPLILQKKCPVLSNDTAETLKLRVQQLEGQALVEAINKLSTLEITLEEL